jgi:RNA polymerase sigma-70 factor (ECF subfamily)
VTQDETEQLTAAMSRGDRRAVGAFYERYFGLLVRFARSAARGRDEHFCLDVVHDAVLRIVRTIKPVKGGESQLAAWLQLVIRSVAYDLLRQEQRRAAREREVQSHPATQAANGCDISEQLKWLRDELRQLDPRLVELIELRYEQRWTLAAIGERLGVSTGTVDGRLRRALDHVRARAKDTFEDDAV